MTQAPPHVRSRLLRHSKKIHAFQGAILAWFDTESRRFPWRNRSASRYRRIVSEVLLQRTRAETVAKFFPFFIKQFPTWRYLAESSDDEMRRILAPIGLWRRRAATLRLLGAEMTKRRGIFPLTRAEIETLPGVGQYIANAVMLFCHRDRQPLLDVNMARVLERCFGPRRLADIRYDPWLQGLSKRVVDHAQAIEINWAVLDLAAKICVIREPRCGECPLVKCCLYGRRFVEKSRGKATRQSNKLNVR